MRPVHAPLAAERDDELIAVEIRPVAKVLAVTFGERVAVAAEAFGDKASIGVDSVGDQQCAHRHYGTR